MHCGAAALPNLLSLSRIPLAGLFLVTFDSRNRVLFWTSLGVIAVALLTDILDGRLARKLRVQSTTGYFLDGLGDKVFYAAILLAIAREDPTQGLLAWTLIARELIWYGARAVDPHRDERRLYLRSLSLFYALIVRVYFAGFIMISWLSLSGYGIPDFVHLYVAAGGLAAVAGFSQIVLLAKVIVVDLESCQRDRNYSHS